ncbi:MAG: helix-turn-helix transcriptional regulator [Bdellovibrionales bacterium]|nr:helix-turn-helix transcriptional regulator [Bdellovibrionales bacterium]
MGEKFGNRLREARQRRGLSAKQLAALVGVSPTTYREWEYGRSIRDAKVYAKLARALEMKLSFLLTGQDADPEALRSAVDDLERAVLRLRTELNSYFM